MVSKLRVALKEEMDSLEFAAKLGNIIHPGLIIYLSGDLGSGKTFIVRALLRALGYQGVVRSPTYTLMESYLISDLHLYHFDFYRFIDPYEWEDLGFRQYFNKTTVTLIEWPEKAKGIPCADLELAITVESTGRELTVFARSAAGEKCLTKL